MPAVMPETVKSQGNQLVVFLTTPPAATTGIPTVAEVNAGLFASCYYYGRAAFVPSQNTGEGPRKACTNTVPTQLGNVNYPAVDMQYSYVPQKLGTPGNAGNALYEALEPDVVVTAVVLNGYKGDVTAVVANDIADIYKVQAGVRRKGTTGDGEFDEESVTQSLIVVGGIPIAEDHKLATA